MSRRCAVLLAVAALVAGSVVGCGGGSDGSDTNGTGTASGRVSLGALTASQLELTLDGAVLEAALAPDGTFSLPAIPIGNHVLRVIGPNGTCGGEATFTILDGGEIELPPIELEPAGILIGTITKLVDGTPQPAAGVTLVARSDVYWILNAAGDLAASGDPTDPACPLIYPPPAGSTYTAVTADDGSYTIEGMLPGEYLVTVAVPGYVTALQSATLTSGATSTLDLELTPVPEPAVGTVAGTVTDSEGSPLAGAVVSVTLESGWEPPMPTDPLPLTESLRLSDAVGAACVPGWMPPSMFWWQFATLTDKDGHYSLNVPAGPCQISAWKWGYEYQGQALTIAADTTNTVDFKLGPVDVTTGPDGRTSAG
jgi:hypothetical protein